MQGYNFLFMRGDIYVNFYEIALGFQELESESSRTQKTILLAELLTKVNAKNSFNLNYNV